MRDNHEALRALGKLSSRDIPVALTEERGSGVDVKVSFL